MVRKLAGEMLAVLGYKVLEARDGHDALRVIDTHSEHIHLLLTDMIMPKMNGQQLAEQIFQVRPRMRVLIMSGYSDETTLQQMVQKGAGFLAKPFSPVSLRNAIREALE